MSAQGKYHARLSLISQAAVVCLSEDLIVEKILLIFCSYLALIASQTEQDPDCSSRLATQEN